MEVHVESTIFETDTGERDDGVKIRLSNVTLSPRVRINFIRRYRQMKNRLTFMLELQASIPHNQKMKTIHHSIRQDERQLAAYARIHTEKNEFVALEPQ